MKISRILLTTLLAAPIIGTEASAAIAYEAAKLTDSGITFSDEGDYSNFSTEFVKARPEIARIIGKVGAFAEKGDPQKLGIVERKGRGGKTIETVSVLDMGCNNGSEDTKKLRIFMDAAKNYRKAGEGASKLAKLKEALNAYSDLRDVVMKEMEKAYKTGGFDEVSTEAQNIARLFYQLGTSNRGERDISLTELQAKRFEEFSAAVPGVARFDTVKWYNIGGLPSEIGNGDAAKAFEKQVTASVRDALEKTLTVDRVKGFADGEVQVGLKNGEPVCKISEVGVRKILEWDISTPVSGEKIEEAFAGDERLSKLFNSMGKRLADVCEISECTTNCKNTQAARDAAIADKAKEVANGIAGTITVADIANQYSGETQIPDEVIALFSPFFGGERPDVEGAKAVISFMSKDGGKVGSGLGLSLEEFLKTYAKNLGEREGGKEILASFSTEEYTIPGNAGEMIHDFLARVYNGDKVVLAKGYEGDDAILVGAFYNLFSQGSDHLVALVKKVRENIAQYQIQLKESEAANEKISAQLKESKAANEKISAQLKESKAANEKISAQLEESKATAAKEVAKYRAFFNRSLEQVNDCEAELTELSEKNEELRSKVSQMEKRLSSITTVPEAELGRPLDVDDADDADSGEVEEEESIMSDNNATEEQSTADALAEAGKTLGSASGRVVEVSDVPSLEAKPKAQANDGKRGNASANTYGSLNRLSLNPAPLFALRSATPVVTMKTAQKPQPAKGGSHAGRSFNMGGKK